jgi:hypothetical protein
VNNDKTALSEWLADETEIVNIANVGARVGNRRLTEERYSGYLVGHIVGMSMDRIVD